MDVQTIDNEFQQLQVEAQQVAQAIGALADKLQTASAAGDANAKEWVLDLKSVALQIQQEQLQTQALLQALHDFAVGTVQPVPPTAPVQAGGPVPEAGGMLSHFRGSGFGQAVAQGAGMGVGFGLMDSVINSIFN